MKQLRVRWLSRRTLFGLLIIAPAAFLFARLDDRVNPFGVILAAVMAVGAGYVLLHLVNATHVSLEDGFLVVRHGPIPWPGGGRWAIADIKRVFVRTHVYGTGGSRKAKSVEFTVDADVKSGAPITLVNGRLTEERAIEVRDAIESWRS